MLPLLSRSPLTSLYSPHPVLEIGLLKHSPACLKPWLSKVVAKLSHLSPGFYILFYSCTSLSTGCSGSLYAVVSFGDIALGAFTLVGVLAPIQL